ncbi:LPXTG-motif cell wall anchor domain protein [Blastococcus saxobsidens DD2]|uniref:LPXTG-motif cell wall anchor domain protein n=1 Tax=Blastococcus saxobsidens (strain DD2) TaxID=1146883 RepID=H6RXC1_BLASD|nr:LPXTG-motif cell wall anchor domain protein [Blastococcus saxobsidens DD2]
MTRVLSVAALSAGFLLVAPAGAGAAEEDGLLRLAHLSPDTPAVDVYVDSVADPGDGTALLTVPGVGYGTISDYQSVPAGVYAVSMRQAGADPTAPPVLSTTVEIGSGDARTVAGVGRFADLGLEVLEDDLTLAPPGQARVRIISAAATAPTLDAAVGGTDLATGLAFAEAGDYATVPGDAGSVRLTVDGEPTELPLDLAPGSVYSLFVLDRPEGGLTVRTVLDAAGSGVVPTGGVETGAGGTAADEVDPAVVSGAAGLTILTGLLLARRSRRDPARHAAGS